MAMLGMRDEQELLAMDHSSAASSDSSYCFYGEESIEQGLDSCLMYRDQELFAEISTASNPIIDQSEAAFLQFDSFGPDHSQAQQQWQALVDCPQSSEQSIESIQGSGDFELGSSAGIQHELVELLVACAQAIASKSTRGWIHSLLGRLGDLASPHGSSAIERLAAYFTEALACRLAHVDRPDLYKPLPLETDPSLGSACSSEAEEEAIAAFHVLNHVSPIVKFAHFSANDAILEAFQGQDKVHIIDLDVGQGLQWPALFQALASRAEGAPSLVRISGVGPFKESIQETSERLAEFARSLGLNFEFHAVVEPKIEEIRLWMLHVKDGHAVAINCIGQLHRSLQQIQGVMELIRSTKAAAVVVVENEAGHNADCFESRFAWSLRYYAALFDALESSGVATAEEKIGEGSTSARSRVERTIFAREIRNIVGCEGEERIERHEKFEWWKKLMEEEGFRNRGMSQRAIVQAKLLLEMFSSKEYRIDKVDQGIGKERCDGITLGWLDQPLLTISSWSIE